MEVVTVMGFVVIFIFCFSLFVQLFFYWIFFARFAYHKPDSIAYPDEEGVSVILCVKNEAHCLKRHLRSFLEQNYSNYEVIVINNNSEDETDSILKEYQNLYPHLNPIKISTHQVNVLEKKMSLAVGIKSAKHEIILIADIDSEPKSPNWVREMAKHYLVERYVVLGYAAYEQKNNILNTLIRYDNIHTALRYFSFALSGYPYRGNARNLSYPRSLFLSNYNYILLYNSQVRDEDLFVNQIVTKNNVAIEYDADTHVLSKQRHETFKEWIEYKRLSNRKGKHYNTKSLFLLHLYHITGFVFYISLLLLVIMFYNNLNYISLIIGLFLIRLISQWIIFGKSIRKLDEKALKSKIPLMDMFFMLIMPLLEVDKYFYKKTKWKQIGN